MNSEGTHEEGRGPASHGWPARQLLTTAALSAVLLAASAVYALVPSRHSPNAPEATDRSLASSLVTEHKYRVIGKVRVLFFWVGNNDVGGARLTSRRDEAGVSTIALLIGTDPARAPRGVNEWGYLREEAQGDVADVFGIRSLTDPDSLSEAEASLAHGTGPVAFGAMCETVTAAAARTSVTNVRTPRDVTYRDFARLEGVVEESPRWATRSIRRPPGAAPGFFAALERLIDASVQAARAESSQTIRSVPYVYKGAVYDLRLRHSTPVAETRIRSRTFHDLIRGDFTIRNRTTGHTTRFAITYPVAGQLKGVVVRASYRPKWWLQIDLVLDETVDVPTDPAGNDSMLWRIRDMCRSHMRW